MEAEVELVTLKGAGHLFPRGGGSADALIDGSREIWQFFQRHSLNRSMNAESPQPDEPSGINWEISSN